MMNDYKKYAHKLVTNGYIPIPIKRSQKRPAIKNWVTMDVTKAQAQKWAENGLGSCGVGLRGGDLVAIDIDVTDKHVIDALVDWCRETIGQTIIRQGKHPKVALFYRTSAPFSRRDSAYYNGGRHTAQHIEARSLETQTVAFGTHPDTNNPYTWLTDETPLNTPLKDLSEIDEHQINDLFEYLDDIAGHAGWSLQADTTGAQAEEGDWMKPKYEISIEDLGHALGHINADDYHRWVNVGQALYHQFDGDQDGLDLWDAWSSNSDKYQSGACEKKWNSFHTTGRRSTVTVGTVISLAQAQGWQNPGIDTEPSEQFPDTNTDPLQAFRIGHMLSTTPPPVPWLIPDFIPANKVCLLTAPGGTGKSLFTLQLAFSVATGLPLAGQWLDVTQGGVLVISGEDDKDDTHRRLYAIYENFTDDFAYSQDDLQNAVQAATTNFHHISMVGKVSKLTHKKGSECQATEGVDKIIKFAKRIPDLQLIIFDPASRFRGGDENSQEDVTRFVEALEHIKVETGATVLIVHHANKASMREGGAEEQYAARGASAFTDGVRWQANMAQCHPDDAQKLGIQPTEAGRYVKLAVAKTNYTAPHEGIWLQRGEGGVLTAFDVQASRYNQERGELDATMAKIYTMIDQHVEDGRPVTRRMFCDLYSGVNNTLGLAEKRLRTMLDMMVEDGTLYQEKSSDANGGMVLLPGKQLTENEDDG